MNFVKPHIFLLDAWLSWNFVRFHEILFQSDAETNFYLENQKKVLDTLEV